MARLQISFDYASAFPSIPADMVVNVYGHALKRVHGRKMRNLLLTPGQPLEIEVDPGAYTVEAFHPSGAVVSEDVDVKPGVDIVGAILPRGATGSDEDTHTGDLEFEALSTSRHRYKGFPNTGSRSLHGSHGTKNHMAYCLGFMTPDKWPEKSTFKPKSLAEAMLTQSWPKDNRSGGPVGARLAGGYGPLTPEVRYGKVTRYEITDAPRGPFRGYDTENYDHVWYFWIEDKLGTPVGFGPLPIPWQSPATLELLRTELDVRCLRSGKYHISVRVRDPWIGSALDFLASGQVLAAEAVVKKALDMLMMKLANPVAAALGGYLLVNGLAHSESWRKSTESWHAWIDNLVNWFQWLPDGLVVRAWRNLHIGGASAADQVRADLLEAHRRGIPFLSIGVTWLYQGLRLLTDETRARGKRDEQVLTAFREVRAYASCLQSNQAFTVIKPGKRR